MKPAVVFLFTAFAAAGQTPSTPLAFEVATIKPVPMPSPADVMSGKMRVGMTVNGSRVDIGFFSLEDLIRTAYKVKGFQISGPNWMAGQRFEIQAKMPEGANKDQVPEMLQALLADRFKLKLHREGKEQSVYEMVVAKSGLKIKESEPDPAPLTQTAAESGPAPANTNQVSVSQDGKGMVFRAGSEGGTSRMTMNGGSMHLEMKKMPISRLAEMLSRFVDHPIVDKTGLTGNYDVGLDLSMEDLMKVARSAGMAVPMPGGGDPGRPADAPSEPQGSIFTSIQQLGLKLEGRKSSVDMLVIDHVEKAPTEN
jgi:uncharacterized protein (TIGR03435 family)